MSSKPVLSRILLKLSGEVLANNDGFGIDPEKVAYLAEEIKPIIKLIIEILFEILILKIWKIPAPNNPGIAKKNENLAASLCITPNNNAVEIVIPDLDIPGIKANTWVIPIINEIEKSGASRWSKCTERERKTWHGSNKWIKGN